MSAEQPSLVATSDMGVGALFSAAFCAESPFLIAAGGAKVNSLMQHKVVVELLLLLQHVGATWTRGSQKPHACSAAAQGTVAVWDTLSTSAVASKYGRRAHAAARAAAGGAADDAVVDDAAA